MMQLKIGININWLFFVIGLLVASVFPPITFLITWNRVGKVRARQAPLSCIPFGNTTCSSAAATAPDKAATLSCLMHLPSCIPLLALEPTIINNDKP